jgi:hypothetical protein
MEDPGPPGCERRHRPVSIGLVDAQTLAGREYGRRSAIGGDVATDRGLAPEARWLLGTRGGAPHSGEHATGLRDRVTLERHCGPHRG